MKSPRWGYFRIITGTIVGGVLGFYVMHGAELMYKVSYSLRNHFFFFMLFLIGNVESKIEEVRGRTRKK